MKAILSLLLLLVVCASGRAQDAASPPRPVINTDIVEMSRAGVVSSVIIAKIKNSECKFDTSPSALVELKEAGVADEILIEMVRNPHGGAQQKELLSMKPSTTPASPSEIKEVPNDGLPEYGDILGDQKVPASVCCCG
jgi:hypothetical protein